jgi:NosR/NirI family nitrous oxide reductase transcriptional regulator
MSPAGEVTGVQVVAQHETPGFFRLLAIGGFYDQFIGAGYDRPLRPGSDLDAISGATFSSEGVAAAARLAIRQIADQGLGKQLPPDPQPIQFGWPEVLLIGLFASGYFGHKMRDQAWKRRIRWGSMLAGMIGLGFIYTAPLTIANFISLLSGYWPDWHANLYWYLLLGGILFVTTTEGKNPYCSWFCPFGAYQECLALVARAKSYRPRALQSWLTWLQRLLALAAILLGLALRLPGGASFEPFATLFDLRGTAPEWALLVLVTLASLLIYRPFCGYLCPIRPVEDFIAAGRRWVREAVRNWRLRSPSP